MTTRTPAQIEAAVAMAKRGDIFVDTYKIAESYTELAEAVIAMAEEREFINSNYNKICDANNDIAEERDRLAKEVERLQAWKLTASDLIIKLGGKFMDELDAALSNTRQPTARGEERRIKGAILITRGNLWTPASFAEGWYSNRRINPERRKP